MNKAILRHRLANWILRISSRVARLVHGPADPEALYYPRKNRPRTTSIDEPSTPHVETHFEKWLANEAECDS